MWIGSSPGGDLEIVQRLLDASERITIATGIVNMWQSDAATTARAYHRIVDLHPGRFLLGLGIGHPEANTGYHEPAPSPGPPCGCTWA